MKSPYKYPPDWLGGFVLGGSPLGGPNNFPVAAGVQKTINSYLYLQWRQGVGSDDLQAFVNSYNWITQYYVDWFCGASLPIYIEQSDGQLDWVALGIYGFLRPLLPMGKNVADGAVNSFVVNAPKQPVNGWNIISAATYFPTTDDIFKRIMTWHLYKGDGKQINVRWLKRRVERFLIGVDGTGGYPITFGIIMALDSFGDPVYWPTWYNIDFAPQISILFAGPEATIRIVLYILTITGGCIPNTFVPNGMGSVLNSSFSTMQTLPEPPLAPVLQAAVDYGVLELPGPYEWTVQIG